MMATSIAKLPSAEVNVANRAKGDHPGLRVDPLESRGLKKSNGADPPPHQPPAPPPWQFSGTATAGRPRRDSSESAVLGDGPEFRTFQCAPTARNTSGGRVNPDSCRVDLVPLALPMKTEVDMPWLWWPNGAVDRMVLPVYADLEGAFCRNTISTFRKDIYAGTLWRDPIRTHGHPALPTIIPEVVDCIQTPRENMVKSYVTA